MAKNRKHRPSTQNTARQELSRSVTQVIDGEKRFKDALAKAVGNDQTGPAATLSGDRFDEIIDSVLLRNQYLWSAGSQPTGFIDHGRPLAPGDVAGAIHLATLSPIVGIGTLVETARNRLGLEPSRQFANHPMVQHTLESATPPLLPVKDMLRDAWELACETHELLNAPAFYLPSQTAAEVMPTAIASEDLAALRLPFETNVVWFSEPIKFGQLGNVTDPLIDAFIEANEPDPQDGPTSVDSYRITGLLFRSSSNGGLSHQVRVFGTELTPHAEDKSVPAVPFEFDLHTPSRYTASLINLASTLSFQVWERPPEAPANILRRFGSKQPPNADDQRWLRKDSAGAFARIYQLEPVGSATEISAPTARDTSDDFRPVRVGSGRDWNGASAVRRLTDATFDSGAVDGRQRPAVYALAPTDERIGYLEPQERNALPIETPTPTNDNLVNRALRTFGINPGRGGSLSL